MISLNEIEIKDFICNETSIFALNVIDVESDEVVYANPAMNDFMIEPNATKCYESIYGNNSPCSWCGFKNSGLETFEYEYFNEKTNKWYQVQSKTTTLKDAKVYLVTIAIDISTQKEAQGKFISTQVKLVKQTEELINMQVELKLLASIDPMTKLFNRRYFTQMSKSLLNLAHRNKTITSVMMIDIDKFKIVNDTYGHQVGDDVIINLALELKNISRKSDIVSRWGGEEFLILLPSTDANGAMNIAEKIRSKVESQEMSVKNNQILKFTVSIGVSQIINNSNAGLESSINEADIALYKAKKSGRNTIYKY